jgi:hypothetical protein
MEGVKNLLIPLEPTMALRYYYFLSPCLSLVAAPAHLAYAT